MYSKKVDRWRMNRTNKNSKIDPSPTTFRAVIDKKTSVEIIKERDIIYWIIKKDLTDYELFVNASEAPVSNLYLQKPDSFENCVVERNIFDKEIFPIADAIKSVFGKKKVDLGKIAVAIGANENDYVTISEKDIKNSRVEPTLDGLKEFIEKNKESILGLGIREYDHEKGNLVFLKSKLIRLTREIISIELLILSSIQQRGYYIQKDHSWIGLQRYIIIKTTKLEDEKLLNFLKELEINWEIIFLRRTLSVNEWLEIECQNNMLNLKAYLRYVFPILSYMDIQNIVRVIEKNNLNFKVAVRMTELLNKQKKELLKTENIDVSYQPIEMAEIIAAARLAVAYHGENSEIEFDDNVRIEDILRFERILTNY
ncbi:MAG: hypothetical protein ACTSVI_10175 [Promethearchaeota archaeon]